MAKTIACTLLSAERPFRPGCSSRARATLRELEASEALGALASRPEGLTAAEAAERQARFGRNTITAERKRPVILVFLSEFVSLMALLLWVGGLVAFFVGQPQLGVAIWAVNVINGVFSFWQEYRAERATAELKKMLSAIARVAGTAAEQQIRSEDLVPGDVIILGEGDRISADARLLARRRPAGGPVDPHRRVEPGAQEPRPDPRATDSPRPSARTCSSPAPASRAGPAAPWSSPSAWTRSSATSRS